MRKHLIIILLFLAALPAGAQFYTSGDDPGYIKWYTVSTDNYKLIYPEGLDSLAYCYGRKMEQYRPALSWSSGYLPGQMYKSKTPVILHAYSGVSNGMVVWAPKRVELHTLPDAYEPWPISWETSLVIHESRHISQMQPGYVKYFKPFYWLLGEMAPGAYSGIYPGPHFLEGDAVVAETALTSSGRGRTGDYLGYYMAAFDAGDWRDWYKWRYGSYKKYAPSYYELGYMTVAGPRYFYSDTLFTKRYFDSTTNHPLRIGHLAKTLRPLTGEKTLRKSGRVIFEKFYDLWKEEAALREPFIPSQRITPHSDWFREYRELQIYEGDIIALMSGKLDPCTLVRITPEGEVKPLAAFSSSTGGLSLEGDRLYWSETITDTRWDQAATSRIRYVDLSDPKYRFHDLTKEGRLYNPAPCAGGEKLLAMDYKISGGVDLVVLSTHDGSELERVSAPAGVQFVEGVWLEGNEIAVSAVSDEGTGLYMIREGEIYPILDPRPVSIVNLLEEDGLVFFDCDRTGVSEIYSLDPKTLDLRQKTSSRYGSSVPGIDDGSIYYTTLEADGRNIYKADEPMDTPVSWSQIHSYPVADALSAQEKALSLQGPPMTDPDSVRFTAPRRYSKIAHIPNFHSWLFPIYIDVDNASQTAYDIIDGKLFLGATGIYQNLLGTATGSVGYSWGPDTEGNRRHAGHFTFTYTGLYPVIEVSAHLNTRAAMQYVRRTYLAEDFREDAIGFGYLPKPYFYSRLRTYVPLNFSSGGWNRGVVPQLSWYISNDRYDKSEVDFDLDDSFGLSSHTSFKGYTEGANVPMQLLTASVSGYTVMKHTSATTYPRLGIGGEVGYQFRPGIADLYSSGLYTYLYGYLPGIVPTQGMRLSALYHHHFDDGVIFGESAVNTTPRGFGKTTLFSVLASSTDQLKLTLDYSIPLYFGDISIFSPIVYITHFSVKPHFDISFFSMDSFMDRSLLSAGAEISVYMSNLIWVPFDASVGVTMSFNGGPSFRKFVEEGVMTNKNRFYIGATYNIPF